MAHEHALLEHAQLLARMLGALSSQSDELLLDAVELVGAARRTVDAIGAELAGEVARRCSEGALAVREGERSAAAVIANRAGVDLAEARVWCEVGRAIAPRTSLIGELLPPQRPELARAFAAAELTVGAAACIARALDEVELRSPDHAGPAELLLIAQAAILSPRHLRIACRTVIDTVDPEGVELRDEELRRRSGLTISRTPEGLLRWVITMHPEAAGFLTAALDARTAPRREPRFSDPAVEGPSAEEVSPELSDTRTLSGRRLDALVSIARESLEHDHGQVAGTAVTMLVTVPLEVLRAGVGAARISGIETPIGAGAARRLAAGAEIIPVVLGGPSEPLDLGCPQRLFSSAQRRALEIRDGGCIWPKCPAPPGWCEAAHVEPWAAGGKTDLDNAILLCPYHHRRFDLDGWSLETRGGVRCLVPPEWVDSTRRPRIVARADVAA